MLASLFEHISIVLKARTFYHLVRQVFQVGHPKDLGSIHRWHSIGHLRIGHIPDTSGAKVIHHLGPIEPAPVLARGFI